MGIDLKDVSVTFRNGVTAVDHIDLTIPSGIYGLLGENGAGKTTLMRVLTTLLKPATGTVLINGIPYQEANYEKIRRRIGYLPQECNLYPNLSVQECLEYMGGLAGVPQKKCKERIDRYLEQTGLTQQRKKKMRQLSGGMKRRVGLIQALLNEPEFLIVDEPTTGLDPEERIRIRNLLVDFSRECTQERMRERTILFSTHVTADLAATCDRLAVMKKGRILYQGSAGELMRMAKGHLWLCRVQNDGEARELEKRYHIAGKQYVEDGMNVRLLSETEPNVPCSPADPDLEDAYLYITHFGADSQTFS